MSGWPRVITNIQNQRDRVGERQELTCKEREREYTSLHWQTESKAQIRMQKKYKPIRMSYSGWCYFLHVRSTEPTELYGMGWLCKLTPRWNPPQGLKLPQRAGVILCGGHGGTTPSGASLICCFCRLNNRSLSMVYGLFPGSMFPTATTYSLKAFKHWTQPCSEELRRKYGVCRCTGR